MLFHLETWPIDSPDYHYPSSFQLLVSREALSATEKVSVSENLEGHRAVFQSKAIYVI